MEATRFVALLQQCCLAVRIDWTYMLLLYVTCKLARRVCIWCRGWPLVRSRACVLGCV
jgi:hypothetical protein